MISAQFLVGKREHHPMLSVEEKSPFPRLPCTRYLDGAVLRPTNAT